MKKIALSVVMLMATVACDSSSPTSPSTTNDEGRGFTPPTVVAPDPSPPPTPVAPGEPTAPPAADVLLFEILNAPVGGCLDFGRLTWDIAVNDAAYRLRTASFHDSEAGCEPTSRLAGGSFRITQHHSPEEFFSYEWNGGQACGRYQADIAIGNPEVGYETIVGVVINTGVNCARTPPEEPTCEELGTCEPPPTCEDLGTCEPPTCEELGNCEPPTCEELGNCEPPSCDEDPHQQHCKPPPCEELRSLGGLTYVPCEPPTPPPALCHIWAGNDGFNEVTLYIPEPAIVAHLQQHQFDYRGVCDGHSPNTEHPDN